MTSLRYVVADVFTDTPLAGNPVAVFTDARELETEQMQRLARELNLSETVFVLPKEADGHARVRIFTPGIEMRFAGHPTLGTAFVLAQPMQLDEIRLETLAGTVPIVLEREGDRLVFGRMEQPVPSWKPYAEPEALLGAIAIGWSARSCRSTSTTTERSTSTCASAPRTKWRGCSRTSGRSGCRRHWA